MSELDELMNLDPLSLTRDSPEIAALVAHYRKARAEKAAGVKPKKERGPTQSLDQLLGGALKAPVQGVTRR